MYKKDRYFAILFIFTFLIILTSPLSAGIRHNYPDLEWQTIETEHFKVNYHNGAENTAQRAARVAETVYEPITSFYDFRPPEKTEIVIKDMNDYSNGGAYYYDNKIVIWATPLDYILRGNHIWLRNVMTHEFAHIVSLGKSMKFSYNVPGLYFQNIGYESERREDVVRGYPNVIVSYPYPGVIMPMWLAEGAAQYNYPGSTNDIYDSHREMILRDRVLNNNLMSLTEMGSFGQRGTGRESVYNQGWAFTKYLSNNYGKDILPALMDEMSEPFEISVNNALNEVTGKPGKEIYQEWKQNLDKKYSKATKSIRDNKVKGKVKFDSGSSQLYPIETENKIYYLSNKGRDYLSQTSLYEYDKNKKKSKRLKRRVKSKIIMGPDSNRIYYPKKGNPNEKGAKLYDIYYYDLNKNKEEQITTNARSLTLDINASGNTLVYVLNEDGTQNIVKYNLETEKRDTLTDFNNFEQISNLVWGPKEKKIYFDITLGHGRNIYTYNIKNGKISPYLNRDCDDRYPYFGNQDKWIYYSSDKTGIFNIYRRNLNTGAVELLTNVTGGAFMPYLNSKGELYYTLYEKGDFKIAKINEPNSIDSSQSHYEQNENPQSPENMELKESVTKSKGEYEESYSRYFVMPRLMIDYGTIKPGFYFFSSEIINNMEIFGGAATNKDFEYDLALLAEYHGWEPTLFIEFYNIQRKLLNETQDDVYETTGDYTYNLKQGIIGIGKPLGKMGKLRLDAIFSSYKSVIDQVTQTGYQEKEALYGFNYEYYRGLNFKLNWDIDAKPRQVHNVTNPSRGMEINTSLFRNYDHFMDTLEQSDDSGLLIEKYSKNYYWKIKQEGKVHHKNPFYENLSGSFKWKFGWISKPNINSFFNFFAGGMPGLKGYSYFSMEGRNLFSVHYNMRHPIFEQKNYDLGWFNLKNCFVGAFVESGNAWDGVKGYNGMNWSKFANNPVDITSQVIGEFKSDVGVELNLSGFSFYAYPTSIQLDFAYGLNKFKVSDNLENTYTYDREWRGYLKILFGL